MQLTTQWQKRQGQSNGERQSAVWHLHLPAHGLAGTSPGGDTYHGWRFHLTDPQTGKHYGFTSAATLMAMLQQATSSEAPAEEAP